MQMLNHRHIVISAAISEKTLHGNNNDKWPRTYFVGSGGVDTSFFFGTYIYFGSKLYSSENGKMLADGRARLRRVNTRESAHSKLKTSAESN